MPARAQGLRSPRLAAAARLAALVSAWACAACEPPIFEVYDAGAADAGLADAGPTCATWRTRVLLLDEDLRGDMRVALPIAGGVLVAVANPSAYFHIDADLGVSRLDLIDTGDFVPRAATLTGTTALLWGSGGAVFRLVLEGGFPSRAEPLLVSPWREELTWADGRWALSTARHAGRLSRLDGRALTALWGPAPDAAPVGHGGVVALDDDEAFAVVRRGRCTGGVPCVLHARGGAVVEEPTEDDEIPTTVARLAPPLGLLAGTVRGNVLARGDDGVWRRFAGLSPFAADPGVDNEARWVRAILPFRGGAIVLSDARLDELRPEGRWCPVHELGVNGRVFSAAPLGESAVLVGESVAIDARVTVVTPSR